MLGLHTPIFGQTLNLITNGSFEDGNSGFQTEFDFSPGDIVPAASYDVVVDPSDSHPSATSYTDNTTGNGLMLAANGSTDSDSVVWSQTVSVLPDTRYEFGLWTSTWFSSAGLQLCINSIDVGPAFTTPSSSGEWQETTRLWESDTDIAFIELVNTTSQFVGNDFAVDDISFAEAPILLGDINLDGVINFSDISPFIAILTAQGFQDEADIDGNGTVNFLDISPFINLLSGA